MVRMHKVSFTFDYIDGMNTSHFTISENNFNTGSPIYLSIMRYTYKNSIQDNIPYFVSELGYFLLYFKKVKKSNYVLHIGYDILTNLLQILEYKITKNEPLDV